MTDRSVTNIRRRRPEARPAEILAAALDLFAERGFAAARLDDVASRAGLSKAAIYLYYKDKTSLLKAIVETTAAANVSLAEELIESHRAPLAPLLRDVLLLLAGRLRDSRLPEVIKLVIAESRAHPEIGRLYLDQVIGRALPLLRRVVERGIAAGEFRAVDPDLTVRCIIAPLLLGAIWKTVFEPIGAEPVDIVALAQQQADLIDRALRP